MHDAGASSALPLRLLTINTWAIRGRSVGARLTRARLGELVQRIGVLAPDVVFCQEVWRGAEAGILKAAPGLVHNAQSDDYASDHVLGAGLLVLSRFPLGPVTERVYSVDARGRTTRRAALFTRAALPGGATLALVCTHLIDNPAARLGPDRSPRGEPMFLGGPRNDPLEQIRAAQLRELFGWIEERTEGPVVLGGDFNTGPQYPLWSAFLGELAETRPALARALSVPWGLGHTYDNPYAAHGHSEGQLDHLLGLRGATITGARVVLTEPFQAELPQMTWWRWLGRVLPSLASRRLVRAYVSDHFGVLAEVRLAETRRALTWPGR